MKPLLHIPRLLFHGEFFCFAGFAISLIPDARTLPFDEMTEEQKKGCKAALDELHSFDVLHQDLKWDNFVISGNEGQVYIIYFGFTAICDDQDEYEKYKLLELMKWNDGSEHEL